MMHKILVLCSLCVVLVACGTDPEVMEPEPGNNDSPGFMRNNDSGQNWTFQTLDTGNVGLFTELAVSSSGKTGAAWFSASFVADGRCEDLGAESPVRKRWSLRYASLEDGAWTVEEVASPGYLGEPPGLSLVFDEDDGAMIAAMSGDSVPGIKYCGAHDAALYVREAPGTWRVETAAVSSSDAATGDAASDYGEVVGFWPALGFLDGEPVLAYKDVHAGSLQSDDQRRADLELAIRSGGTWTQLPVDPGTSAGDFTSLVVGEDGALYLAYVRPFERTGVSNSGIWVARSLDRGQSWDFVQLFPQATGDGPSMIMTEEGLAVLFYNNLRGYPQLARLRDVSLFSSIGEGWTMEDIGENGFDEGYSASLVSAPGGKLAAAWYRCNRVEAGLGECEPDTDGVVVAWESGAGWSHKLVDTGNEVMCGTHPSLRFGAAGQALLLYDCEAEGDEGLERQVKLATRRVFP